MISTVYKAPLNVSNKHPTLENKGIFSVITCSQKKAPRLVICYLPLVLGQKRCQPLHWLILTYQMNTMNERVTVQLDAESESRSVRLPFTPAPLKLPIFRKFGNNTDLELTPFYQEKNLKNSTYMSLNIECHHLFEKACLKYGPLSRVCF